MKLFIDDERLPPDESWTVVRTNEEAMAIVERLGMPELISFDHDLGRDETGTRITTEFIIWLITYHLNETIPCYVVHSANPVGRDNIISLMESWRKVRSL